GPGAPARAAPPLARAVLALADPGADRGRTKALHVVAQVAHDLLDQVVALAGVVDREVARPAAEVLDFAPQDARAGRVEGADPQALHREEGLAALAHLARGLVGEGDREDLVRSRAARGDEPGDAARDDARLARARPGQDQERALAVDDRRALLGGQVGE